MNTGMFIARVSSMGWMTIPDMPFFDMAHMCKKILFVLSSWGAMWDEPAARPISSFGADRLALQPVLKEDPGHVPDINPYGIMRSTAD